MKLALIVLHFAFESVQEMGAIVLELEDEEFEQLQKKDPDGFEAALAEVIKVVGDSKGEVDQDAFIKWWVERKEVESEA